MEPLYYMTFTQNNIGYRYHDTNLRGIPSGIEFAVFDAGDDLKFVTIRGKSILASKQQIFSYMIRMYTPNEKNTNQR